MILPTYYSSLRSRNVSLGHILTFSPLHPVSLDQENDSDQSDTLSGTESDLGHAHSLPPGGKRGRVRVLSESEASSVAWGAEPEFQGAGSRDAPFRGRSQSAPAALWAAKRYGRQLRRMSDEFDTWLDRGGGQEVKRGHAGAVKASSSWFSFLWPPRETEDELHGNGVLTESEAPH